MAKKPQQAEDSYRVALNRIKADEKRLSWDQSLDLSGLGLVALPPEIGHLADLRFLDLSNNKLATLPPEIGRLTELTTLNLFNNRLAKLAPEMSSLTKLTWLDLRSNQLTTLLPVIRQLTKLTSLDLTGNKLTTLPSEVGRLTELTRLELRGNRLTTLPPEVGKLTNLRSLDLEHTELMALPPEIGRLTALTSLDLRGNKLTTLPPEIGKLTALQALYLQGNQLTTLPPEIGSLTKLWELDLSDNRLTTLPSEIAQLIWLGILLLHGNPGLGLPVEVLGPTESELRPSTGLKPKPPSEVLASYFRIAGEGGESLGECKLIVVGRGQAGKTSLIKRLRGHAYDPEEAETHGITIQQLKFDGQQGQVTARVWDFGGQVVLHSMHEFFLTARSLYLLVLGERDDMLERDVAYWLQLIRSYAGDAPVVVALNKSAGRQRHFDRDTLERNYGPILGWVATECSEPDDDAAGVTRLRQTLTAALDSPYMESARRKFPKKWRAIKANLEGMTESFLEYEDYAARCRALGETDDKEQEALAADLHDLGVALNYGRDPRLRDTTVLRPDWLANGIYAVLRANDLDDAQLPPALNVALAPDGVITAESLAVIHQKAQAWRMLQADDYPPNKREFLLRLLDLFHLSYPLDDEGREQLVPTLLPLNPPAGSDEPDGAERVRLRFEFQVVPAPLLPWFIARTFSLIPNRLHWRRGAVLAFGDAHAKVWATQDDRYVFATVAGPERDKQRLLAIIRGTLHKVFNEYRALSPVEQWEHNGKWVPRDTLEEFGVLPRERYDDDDDRSMKGEATP
jgi:internalin A